MSPAARPVRVGVNLLWLVPGVVGGSEEYTTRLLRGLAQSAPADLEGWLLHAFDDASTSVLGLHYVGHQDFIRA